MIQCANEVKVEAGITCPKCHSQLPYAAVLDVQTDRYKRTIREYFGWCDKCDCGCDVVQFIDGNTWRVHKYRYYEPVEGMDAIIPPGEWQMIDELPEPAPIVIGPGGDFDQPIKLKGNRQ
jgi:hypothetical protein